MLFDKHFDGIISVCVDICEHLIENGIDVFEQFGLSFIDGDAVLFFRCGIRIIPKSWSDIAREVRR